MSIDPTEFRAVFFEEAREHADEMERGLLLLETKRDDSELLNGVFRAAHSIKGAAGIVGLAKIAQYTHSVEELLDAMRKRSVEVTAERISDLLRATDDIRQLVQAAERGEHISLVPTARLIHSQETATRDEHNDREENLAPHRPSVRRLRLTITPSPRFFATALDPLLIFQDLQKVGQVTEVVCDFSRVPRLSELIEDTCAIAWSVLLQTTATDEAIRDVFLFVSDDCTVTIDPEEPAAAEPVYSPRSPQAPVAVQVASESATLRVTSDKVDSIIDLVGELVIAQSMVMQHLANTSLVRTPTLRDALGSMTRNMQELQERVMGIRMVPIGSLFGRFNRLVRDTASLLGKTVKFALEGQDTEIDKAVVERLVDPITHLVRNAIDHGLETDDVRARLHKREPATLRLDARHVAGGIMIEVADNGRGLPTQAIRAKAEQLGLLSPTDSPTDDQIHALIFEPGFSTAPTVSDLSGRGVGMDVVRRSVDSLNGTISIVTEAGRGTTFQIRLPLTLAILDGLLLKVGRETYILPLLAVVESFRPGSAAVKPIAGGESVAIIRGTSLPLIDLGIVFGMSGHRRPADASLVIVVEADGRRVGLVVDSLLGQSQVVVKSVETHYRRVDGVLGATILGDGHVAFILDVAGIVRLAWSRRSASSAIRAA